MLVVRKKQPPSSGWPNWKSALTIVSVVSLVAYQVFKHRIPEVSQWAGPELSSWLISPWALFVITAPLRLYRFKKSAQERDPIGAVAQVMAIGSTLLPFGPLIAVGIDALEEARNYRNHHPPMT